MKRQRLFGILLGLVMAMGLILGMTVTANADTAPDETWSENQNITESRSFGTVTVTADITVTIAEGVTLNVSKGIDATGHTLTVAGSGKLIVNGATGSDGVSTDQKAAVDGSNGSDGIVGNLTVKGPAVEVRGGNGGVGSSGEKAGDGGNGGNGIVGNVTVDGGSIIVSGGDGGKGGDSESSSFYDIGYPGENGKAVNGTVNVAEGFTLEESADNTTWTTVFGNTTQKRYAKIEKTTILKYPLWVGGVQVTSANAGDVLNGTSNKGKASFDPKTNTLTLNEATICGETTFAMYNRWDRSANICVHEIDLKIRLEGTNVIDSGETPADYAICSDSEKETKITGEGTLTVEGNYGAIYIDDADCTINGVQITAKSERGYTIAVWKKLLIEGAQITASAASEESDAIHASGEVEIKGSTVTATGTDRGIYGGDRVTIEDGTVHATGTKAGIFSYGDITIKGGDVTAAGTNEGIHADKGNVTISGGTVNATGTNEGIHADKGNVTISGGTVTATGTEDGIYVKEGNVTISGGTVTATGTEGGIYTEDGNVTIEGGRVDASAEGRVAAGIFAYSDVTIKDGRVDASAAGREAMGIFAYSDVTIEGGHTEAFATGRETVGIYTYNNITIKDGTVTASGKGKGSYSGIEAEKEVMISGGTVNASSDSIGILSDDSRNITITGGRVDANGGENGICSDNGKVTITGGNVTSFGGDGCGVCSAEITIGEKVAGVSSAGTVRAFAGYDKDYINNKVKNSIVGTGWINTEGTGKGESIDISTTGRALTYKKIRFPADTVQQVVDMINALPDPDKVTEDDEKAVREAREAYNNLSDAQKQDSRLTPAIMQRLADCEAALEKAKKEKEDQEAADKVSKLIADIPEDLSQATSDQVSGAVEAYHRLTADQKKLIADTELAKLQKALNYPATMVKAKVRSVKARKGGKAVVRWGKKSAANGYLLSYKAKGVKEKKVSINSANTLKKTVKKLKAGKKYTFKVRAFTKVENLAEPGTSIKVYGKWSNVRKIKAR